MLSDEDMQALLDLARRGYMIMFAAIDEMIVEKMEAAEERLIAALQEAIAPLVADLNRPSPS